MSLVCKWVIVFCLYNKNVSFAFEWKNMYIRDAKLEFLSHTQSDQSFFCHSNMHKIFKSGIWSNLSMHKKNVKTFSKACKQKMQITTVYVSIVEFKCQFKFVCIVREQQCNVNMDKICLNAKFFIPFIPTCFAFFFVNVILDLTKIDRV